MLMQSCATEQSTPVPLRSTFRLDATHGKCRHSSGWSLRWHLWPLPPALGWPTALASKQILYKLWNEAQRRAPSPCRVFHPRGLYKLNVMNVVWWFMLLVCTAATIAAVREIINGWTDFKVGSIGGQGIARGGDAGKRAGHVSGADLAIGRRPCATCCRFSATDGREVCQPGLLGAVVSGCHQRTTNSTTSA